MKLRINASQMSKMDTCGYAYKTYYNDHLEAAVKNISLVFGDCVHRSITGWIIDCANGNPGMPPVERFNILFFEETRKHPLSYPDKWTEADFRACGQVMIARFVEWWNDSGYVPLMGPQGPWVERMLTAKLGGPGILPNFPSVQIELYGTPDIIALNRDGEVHDLDLKTTAAEYDPMFILNSDQLITYDILMDANKQPLGIDGVDGKSFIQLVRRKVSTRGGKGPTIEVPEPTPRASDERIAEFKRKVIDVAEDILRERFHRKSHSAFNSPCGMCDARDLCTKGDMSGLTHRQAA